MPTSNDSAKGNELNGNPSSLQSDAVKSTYSKESKGLLKEAVKRMESKFDPTVLLGVCDIDGHILKFNRIPLGKSDR